MNTHNSDDNRHIYTISELNSDVRVMLETGFPLIWLEGEISNFAAPSSGHWYFSLKDNKAQVRCAMFKNRSAGTDFIPKQGDKVIVKARISLYEARGEYQLIIENMQEAGFGALQRQFDALKKKLETEGLFSPAVKQALPKMPKQIGVITSPTGAAIRDILSVLQRRFPAVPVVIYPTLVQGDTAARQIAKRIQQANTQNICDVLIVARGGGSLEDLWAFNEEVVARAIFQSRLPIVSGVGHEIDITIADFVADKRASTPSAAAELVVPDVKEILQRLKLQQLKLVQRVKQVIKHERLQLTHMTRRLKHPAQQLREMSQKIDDLELRLRHNMQRIIHNKVSLLQQKTRLLQTVSPIRQLALQRKSLMQMHVNLLKLIQQTIQAKRNELALNAKTLNAFSPLATLERGYSIVKQRNNNCIVNSSDQVKINDELDIQLHHGKLICTVKKTTVN